MISRARLTLLTLAFLLLAPVGAAAQDTSTTVFIDVERALELAEGGATLLDAREESDFRRAHLPDAVSLPWRSFVDGDQSGAISDDHARHQRRLRAAGVFQDRPVIVYGNWSNRGAWGEEGRLFWALEYFGHSQVYLLTGGIDAWRAADQPVSSGARVIDPRTAEFGDFQIRPRESRRATTAELLEDHRGDGAFLLLDTREPTEYRGRVRYGEARPGHIPGAVHLWWRDLFDDDGDLLSPSDLQALLESRGISLDRPLVAYCTGGIRSGFVYAVLRSLGAPDVRNYDASMWDWTARDDAPLSTP